MTDATLHTDVDRFDDMDADLDIDRIEDVEEVEEPAAQEDDADAPAAPAARQQASAPVRQTARKAIEKYRDLAAANPRDVTAAALVLGCRDDAADVAVAVLSSPRVPTKLLDRLDQIAASEDPMDAVVEVMALDSGELKRVGALLTAVGISGSFGGGDTSKQVKAIARAVFDQSTEVRDVCARLRAIIRK